MYVVDISSISPLDLVYGDVGQHGLEVEHLLHRGRGRALVSPQQDGDLEVERN